MIVCTKSAITLARRALGQDKVTVGALGNILEQLTLDANVASVRKEAYIISELDMRKTKEKRAFVEALKRKHPSNKIIVLAKSKANFQNIAGIDRVLDNATQDSITEALASLIDSVEDKVREEARTGAEEVKVAEPVQMPEEYTVPNVEEVIKMEEEVVEEPKDMITHFEPGNSLEPMPAPEEFDRNMVERIRACGSMVDLQSVAKEVTAATIVKELLEENNEYAAIEEKLKVLQTQIHSIMIDMSIPNLEEKWDRIRAVTYDRTYYAAKSSTILEQRVEEIIKTIVDRTQELLKERTDDIDKAIDFYRASQPVGSVNFPTLSGLLSTRSSILLDITVLSVELDKLAQATDAIAANAIQEITGVNSQVTGMPELDRQIQARGENITSKEGLDVLKRIATLSLESTSMFETLKIDAATLNEKVMRLLETDNDIIQAQSELIKYLTSRNLEDTVVANSIIKRAMRVYVGEEGVGRSIIPYIVSKLRARTLNANVLHIDVTGTNKLDNYGVDVIDLYDWLESMREEQMCVVAGDIPEEDMASVAQRLSNALVRAADYYRVINVIIRPDQRVLLDTLAPDTLSVNFVTDINPSNIDKTCELMNTVTLANVAQKVIINKCPNYSEAIVRRLGLMDRLGVSYTRVPFIQQISDCAINGVDPSVIDVVNDLFVEVMTNA